SSSTVDQRLPSEQAISFRISYESAHSLPVITAKRSAVGAEWEFANAHIDPFFFRLIFGETDAGEFGICVNDTGNGFVVYVTGLARDDLYAGNRFVLCFLR